MRALALAAVAALIMTPEVRAFCPTFAADAWQGAQQQTAQTLCLHRELSQHTEAMAEQARLAAALATLAAEAERRLQQQRAAYRLME